MAGLSGVTDGNHAEEIAELLQAAVSPMLIGPKVSIITGTKAWAAVISAYVFDANNGVAMGGLGFGHPHLCSNPS